jgi:polar amino acid transport system substrate-binding protein
MSKRVLYWAAGFCLVCAILMAGCTGTTDPGVKTYVVGIDNAYPPYAYIDGNGTLTGFDIESLYWIAENQGFNFTIKPVLWDEIIPALQNGEIDMIYSGMIITPDRAEIVSFSEPYWQINQGVVVRSDSDITMDDVTGGRVTIGVQKATAADTWLQDNMVDYDQKVATGAIIQYETFPDAIAALEADLCDVAIFADANAGPYIEGKSLKMLGSIPTGEEYGVAVRKGDTGLLDIVNTGLTELRASPKWEELKIKYQLEG